VRDVWKRYRRYTNRSHTLKARTLGWLRGRPDQYEEFQALRNVTFAISRGEMVGIIGRNGAGKSTLLRVLAQIVEPDHGSVSVKGRLSPLLELGGGFSSELTGRRNIFLYGALLGLNRADISARIDSIIQFSGIPEFIDTPIKHYSSGMLVRLAFAVAAHIDPDVLLLDEVLTVGDAAFQEKSRERMQEFRRAGCTIVLVTHIMDNVTRMCDRAILIDHGVVLDDGGPSTVVATYRRLIEAGEQTGDRAAMPLVAGI